MKVKASAMQHNNIKRNTSLYQIYTTYVNNSILKNYITYHCIFDAYPTASMIFFISVHCVNSNS